MPTSARAITAHLDALRVAGEVPSSVSDVDPRDPFGRKKIGVKISDEMRKTPPPMNLPVGWKPSVEVEDLQAYRQDINASRLMEEQRLEGWRRYVERGQEDLAEVSVQREFGISCTLTDAVAAAEERLGDCRAEIHKLDFEITSLLWEQLYPNAPSRFEYDQLEHRDVRAGRDPLDFDHTDALFQMLWFEIVEAFSDQGFGENAEILVSMQERLGLGGTCQLVVAIRNHDIPTMERLCALVTENEKAMAGQGGCYCRLRIRRGAGGAPVILIDQPGNPDYIAPPFPLWTSGGAFDRRRRFGSTRRESKGKPCRTRGSRRVGSRSAGGGSSGSDEPPGEPEPARRRGLLGELFPPVAA